MPKELLKYCFHIYKEERYVIFLGREFEFVSGKEKEKIKLFGNNEFRNSIDSRMEIVSNKEVTVEGCRGVLEFAKDYVKINLHKGNVILYGKNFDINGFEEDVITVRGNIGSIEFCVSEGDNG